MLSLLAVTLPRWLHLPEGVSSYSGRIDGMFHLIMWITGIIFVVVEVLLLYFLFRYRAKDGDGRKARYTHGNNRLEVIWTIIPALICVVLALLSRRVWTEIKQQIPQDGIQIEVTGEQFSWTIRYPGKDGKFGTDDDVVSLNQLHFPVGRPIVATLRSKDVIHSFYLPEFRVKQDAVPGMSTRIWFDATRTGTVEGAARKALEKWLASQAPGTPPAAEQPNANPANPPASAPSSTVTPAAAGQEAKSTS